MGVILALNYVAQPRPRELLDLEAISFKGVVFYSRQAQPGIELM